MSNDQKEPATAAPSETASPPGPVRTYVRNTRTWTYSFLAILPLLFAYEFLILACNNDDAVMVRVSADVWLTTVLSKIGGQWHLSMGTIVLLIGIFIILAERRKKIDIRLRYLSLIVFEGLAYAIFLWLVLSFAVGQLFAYLPLADVESDFSNLDLGLQLALSIGAGLYEEMVFRVIVVIGLAWLLCLAIEQKVLAYVLAAIAGAFVFSLVHYIGTMSDEFDAPSFVFRFLFGLALNIILLTRGFGIAAWTHSLYNVMIVMVMWIKAG